MGALTWLLDPSNAPVVSLAGLVLSLLGFPPTIVGLYWTYKEAKAAVGAAEAASSAVENVKVKLAQYDAFKDLSLAAYAIKTANQHLDRAAWTNIVQSYEDAREAIIRIAISVPDLHSQQRLELNNMAEQMRRFCDKVDKAKLGKAQYPEVDKAKSVIRKNYGIVADVQRFLVERVGG